MSAIRENLNFQSSGDNAAHNQSFAANYDRNSTGRGFGCGNMIILLSIAVFIIFVFSLILSPEVQSQFIQIAGL